MISFLLSFFSHLDIYQNNTSRRQDIYSNDEAQYLQPDERNFTITFAALDYVNSPDYKIRISN